MVSLRKAHAGLSFLLKDKLRKQKSRVTNDFSRVVRIVGRSRVFYEGGAGRANLLQRDQHGHGRTQSAHRDLFSLTDPVEAGGIELQDFFDREIVLVHGG